MSEPIDDVLASLFREALAPGGKVLVRNARFEQSEGAVAIDGIVALPTGEVWEIVARRPLNPGHQHLAPVREMADMIARSPVAQAAGITRERIHIVDEAGEEGRRRYPPYGVRDGLCCTCLITCDDPCSGKCGCMACNDAYQDFLSLPEA